MPSPKKITKLELRNISKSFGDIVANDNISFCVNAGEILGVLGENGAGKSTLMNILYGIYAPDAGEIFINDKRVSIRSPRDAIKLGIGMVHQHFMLIANHTVAENIALGLDDTPFFFPQRFITAKLKQFQEQYGLKINPEAYIWQLSAGEQQRVEIIKVLLRGADLLIFDEPTSVLTPQETEELFAILRQLVAKGKTVIFISHKLGEVLKITNRIAVLRQGKLVGLVETSKTSTQELARMMIDRELSFQPPVTRGYSAESVLAVEQISVKNDIGLMAVRNLSFVVHKGEIFGIAGVAGNGQRELVEALTGLRKIETGTVKINGIDITNTSARFVASNKISHIPEERLRFGVVPAMTVYENSVLNNYYRAPFASGIFLNYSQIKNFAYTLLREFDIQASSIKARVKNLSGGNIQKLILARELANNPQLLIAAHPTYGLDIAATEFIRGLLLKKKKDGCAILLVSEDLEELLILSDHIAVMFEGKFMGILKNKEVNIEQIGLMMAGIVENKDKLA